MTVGTDKDTWFNMVEVMGPDTYLSLNLTEEVTELPPMEVKLRRLPTRSYGSACPPIGTGSGNPLVSAALVAAATHSTHIPHAMHNMVPGTVESVANMSAVTANMLHGVSGIHHGGIPGNATNTTPMHPNATVISGGIKPQFRDPSTAPLRKLSVDLIKTYKHSIHSTDYINQIYCFEISISFCIFLNCYE